MATWEWDLKTIGRWKAQASLTAKQYHFVTLNSTYQTLEAVNATGDKPEGILRNAPALGADCELVIGGYTKLEAGSGDLAVHDWVKTDATGNGVATTTDTDLVRARCVVAGAEGELAVVKLVEFTLSA